MKTADIVIGGTYALKVPEIVDAGAYWDRKFGREIVWGVVLGVEQQREVPHYTTYGGIAGTPRVITGYGHAGDGVKVRLVKSGRVVTISPRGVLWRHWDEREDG